MKVDYKVAERYLFTKVLLVVLGAVHLSVRTLPLKWLTASDLERPEKVTH